ncbi:MAG: hypothetical protein ACM3ZB_06385 [bacterium]
MSVLLFSSNPVGSTPSDEARVFTLLGAGQPRWRAFTASVVLHIIVIATLPSVSLHTARFAPAKRLRRSDIVMNTLRIRIPERLYLAASSPAPQPRPRSSAAPRRVPRRNPVAAPKPEPPRAGSGGARRRFELPPAIQRVASEQSLIQPTPNVLEASALKLPEMFFWSPASQRLPAKPFVEPGHATRPVQEVKLNAPPRIDAPGPTISAIPPAALSEQALLLPPPASLPVRTSAEDAGPAGAVTIAPGPGDPTNVLALSAEGLPLREYVTVPPGVQIGHATGIGGGTLAGSDAGSGRGFGAGTGSGTGSGAGTVQGTGSGEGAGTAEGGLDDFGSAEFLAAVEATRKVNPSDGIFDVVVQSSSPEGFTASAGVLSGKPVYSVYLKVGAKRDWILQYCIPAADQERPKASGMVVSLSSPKKLSAPFPLVTYRPPARRATTRYLTLHGYISAEGRFEDLGVFGVHDPWHAAAALVALKRWEFRPATADGKPSRVEILLAIPPE